MYWADDLDHPLMQAFDIEAWDENRCARVLVEFLGRKASGTDETEMAMHAMNLLDCWGACIAHVAGLRPKPILGTGLISFWRAYGLWIVPRGLKDGLPAYVDALRRHLPPYKGPGVTLYRGELEARHLKRTYGIAWTTDLVYAGIFARNREYKDAKGDMVEGPGVVLRIEATPSMIVVDEPTYGKYLKAGEHEYIIDPRMIGAVTTVPYAEIPDEYRH